MLRRNQKNLVYLFILFIPFFLFFTPAESWTSLKFGFIRGLSVPIRLVSVPIREIKKILFYHRTFEEYKRLREEVDSLKARLVGFDEVMRENARLERLLEFKRKLIYSSVAASVVGRDPSSWNSSMIINKGGQDGIRQGMPVMNALGVVGKIAEAGERQSKVILLTDPQFSVAALVQGSREFGLVSGTLQEGLCRMRYLNADARVNVGDKVITSKLSSSFPEGLLIGEVVEIIPSAQKPTKECLIKPVVLFSQIEEVLVILKGG